MFYTNYESQKGKELGKNTAAVLLFFWKELVRQVRINGNVEKISEEESNDYFHSRPRESQLGAWASEQSSRIPNRKVAELLERSRLIFPRFIFLKSILLENL